MKQFDYKAAWNELAFPAYQKLPERVRIAHVALAPLADECTQAKDCSLKYPEDPEKHAQVNRIIGELSTEDLAHGAAVIYACGHWYPSSPATESFASVLMLREFPGNTWKIARWFSQEIEKRLGLTHHTQEHGNAYCVQEGMLHATYASKWCWFNRKVGFATEENLAIARKIQRENATPTHRRVDDDKRIDAFERKCKRIEAKTVSPESLRNFINLENYMVEESKP